MIPLPCMDCLGLTVTLCLACDHSCLVSQGTGSHGRALHTISRKHWPCSARTYAFQLSTCGRTMRFKRYVCWTNRQDIATRSSIAYRNAGYCMQHFVAARWIHMMHVQGQPQVVMGLLGQLRSVYKYKAAPKSNAKGGGHVQGRRTSPMQHGST